MNKPFLIALLFFIKLLCFAQKGDTNMRLFRQTEIELQQLQNAAFHSRIETERIEGNKQFLAVWESIVQNPKILDYEFTLLKDISVLSPKNKKFKLITWNLYKDDGTHIYFGYLLVNNSKRIKKGFLKFETITSYDVFKLVDRSMTVSSPERYAGSPQKWFGMLYTQLVECDDFYTLIGWDGNNKLTQRKFIDVLYFKSNGDPVFGKDVFKFPRKNPRRLMFEYSTDITMSVRYNEKRNQIIYSHLSSKKEGTLLEGEYQYYGPDGSFDALEMKKGKWVTIEDVDVKSEIQPMSEKKKPDPNKQSPVYQPK